MKPKTIKIIYWIVTILFSLAMLMSGITSFMPSEEGIKIMTHLGYPMYLNTILGVAKIIGVIALLQTKWNTLKEWAYAGFMIDIVGASASFLLVGDGMVAVLFPLVFLVVMYASYFLWKSTLKIKTVR